MSVEIKIYGETAKDALDELSGLASGMRPAGFRPELAAPYGTGPAMTADEAYAAVAKSIVDQAVIEKAETLSVAEPHAGGNAGDTSASPARKRGEPSPGKKRRTAAEVAEDEAAEAAESAARQNISTGENRIDPASPEVDDSAEDTAQDAADEAAEVEAHRDPEKPLTIDDVKAVVMAYAEKYGMPAAQADGPRIFVEALGAPPKGEEFWKFSILPVDDQGKIQKVISIWQRATTENPFKH